MKNIRKREYRNEDFGKVFQFMINTYEIDWKNGVPAPFFQHAQGFPWTDREKNHLNAIWEEDGNIIAFCFFESSIGTAFFNIKEGWDNIVPEMIEHAEKHLCSKVGCLQLKLFEGQKNVISVVEKNGYKKIDEAKQCIYRYSKGALDYKLPEGFFFEEPDNIDLEKEKDAFWRGFDNTTERPRDGNYSPADLGSTKGMDVVAKNEKGEYVCCAGMYMVPEINLAYMEPLATIAKYRNKGIASAVLSEMYRRTLRLGATHKTGGYNKYYYDLGFEPLVVWTTWKK